MISALKTILVVIGTAFWLGLGFGLAIAAMRAGYHLTEIISKWAGGML